MTTLPSLSKAAASMPPSSSRILAPLTESFTSSIASSVFQPWPLLRNSDQIPSWGIITKTKSICTYFGWILNVLFDYSKTYQLTIQDDFLGRMQTYRDPYNVNIQQKFTFLVPSDEAWETIHRTMGSAFKKLFMGEYSYNVSFPLMKLYDEEGEMNTWQLFIRCVKFSSAIWSSVKSWVWITWQWRDETITCRPSAAKWKLPSSRAVEVSVSFQMNSNKLTIERYNWRSCQFVRCANKEEGGEPTRGKKKVSETKQTLCSKYHAFFCLRLYRAIISRSQNVCVVFKA